MHSISPWFPKDSRVSPYVNYLMHLLRVTKFITVSAVLKRLSPKSLRFETFNFVPVKIKNKFKYYQHKIAQVNLLIGSALEPGNQELKMWIHINLSSFKLQVLGLISQWWKCEHNALWRNSWFLGRGKKKKRVNEPRISLCDEKAQRMLEAYQKDIEPAWKGSSWTNLE